MKRIHFSRLVTVLAVLSALALSCSRELIPLDKNVPDAGEQIQVSLGLRIVSLSEGTSERAYNLSETRALVDTESVSCIKDLWVAQYDGTADTSLLMGNPVYLDSTELQISGGNVKGTLKMIATSDSTTVFLLSNTFDSGLVFPGTLGEIKSFARGISFQDDLFGKSSLTDSHVMFSGFTVLPSLTSGTSINAGLCRNIAKVTLHVVNSSFGQTQPLTVNSVRLASVPNTSFYFPLYGAPSTLPAASSFSTIEYPSELWSGNGDQSTAADSCDFTFYVPVNKRGTTANAAASMKPRYNPDGLGTYAIVECTYKDSTDDLPINYHFYLGANLVNDFNIECNKSYYYRIELKNKGTNLSDYRIYDYGTVDYSANSCERANCYILNPPDVDNYWRTFKIPVDRVNTFWGLTSGAYESNVNYQIYSNTEWVATVIWSDFTFDGSDFRFTSAADTLTGTGTDPITVQVKKGASGNALVGLKIKYTSGGNVSYSPYLWSWHLWITDYAPDDVTKYNVQPLTNVYDYDVTGGKVHRPSYWKGSTFYPNSFLMDRNVGAMDIEYHDYNVRGVLYYQYGRKDPLYYPKIKSRIACTNTLVKGTGSNSTQPVIYSIANPDTFITGNPWNSGNKYNPSSYKATMVWMDPQASTSNNAKSIFDPCPKGWKLVRKGCFPGVQSDNNRYVYYFGNLVFPMVGQLVDGYCTDVKGLGRYVYDTCSSSTTANCTLYQISNNSTIYSLSYGYPVRCVSE